MTEPRQTPPDQTAAGGGTTGREPEPKEADRGGLDPTPPRPPQALQDPDRAPRDPGPGPDPAQAPRGSARARRSGSEIVRLGLLFYGALGLVALGWRSWLGGASILFASEAGIERGVRLGPDLAAGLLAGAIVVLISYAFTRWTRAGDALARALASALGPITLGQALVLAAVSALAEEAFFRGALQPRVGLVAASLLFGLIHFVPRRELLPWTGFSIAAGFLLGGLFEITGNLVAPIVAHFVVNGVNLPLIVRYASPPTPPDGEPPAAA